MNNDKTFVFYTKEGTCFSPSGEEVENYQIIGFESGKDIDEALRWLLINNLWIKDCGYNINKIEWKELI